MSDVVDFVREHEKVYRRFLMRLNHYPYVCEFASDILGAYLHKKFSIKGYFTHGYYKDKYIHNWLRLEDDTLIDFLLFQFYKFEDGSHYNEQVIGQLPVIVEEEQFLENYLSTGIVYFSKELCRLAENSKDFESYLLGLRDYLLENNLIE